MDLITSMLIGIAIWLSNAVVFFGISYLISSSRRVKHGKGA